MIERLELKNFTGFNRLTLSLSPKVNLIIAEHSTGTIQLLPPAEND